MRTGKGSMYMINKNSSQTEHCLKSYEEELWIDYVLNNLTPQLRRALQHHLLTCIPCQKYEHEWKQALSEAYQTPSYRKAEQTLYQKQLQLIKIKLKKLKMYFYLFKNKYSTQKKLAYQKRFIMSCALAILLFFPVSYFIQAITEQQPPLPHKALNTTEQLTLIKQNENKYIVNVNYSKLSQENPACYVAIPPDANAEELRLIYKLYQLCHLIYK